MWPLLIFVAGALYFIDRSREEIHQEEVQMWKDLTLKAEALKEKISQSMSDQEEQWNRMEEERLRRSYVKLEYDPSHK